MHFACLSFKINLTDELLLIVLVTTVDPWTVWQGRGLGDNPHTVDKSDFLKTCLLMPTVDWKPYTVD